MNDFCIASEQFGTHFLVYLYDESGAPIGLQYRNKSDAKNVFYTYYFEKNLQGDIIAIYTENGTKIGSYTYDAWGNCTISTESGTTTSQKRIVRTLNPFRYRGYYYDYDTGLYYLQSRYYVPQWGRFLNADSCLYNRVLGFNLFLYCDNNPVNLVDPSGEDAVALLAGWASTGWGLVVADGPIPIGDLIYVVGCVFLGMIVIAESVFVADIVVSNVQKDDMGSLPDEKDVKVDIDHIMENHHPSSGKGPRKDKFPDWMTGPMIEETVRQAYQNAKDNFPDSVIKIQQDIRYYLEGTVAGEKIRIWIDTVEKVIKTAFPKC